MNEGSKVSSKFLPVMVLITFMITWELTAKVGIIPAMFFPPPSRIWFSLLKLIGNGELPTALSATLFRFSLGLICGSVLGALFGLMMGWWPFLYNLFNPIMAAVYPIPKIAIFPLLMIIFGFGEGSKFVAVLLAAFFPMLITSLAGVWQISKVYFEVGKNYGAHGRQMLTHILLPGSLPSLLSGLRLSTNMAFVIAISVEIVAAKTGLGVLLWFGWQTFRVSELYAVLVVISLLGIIFNFLLDRLTRLCIPWMGE